MGKTKIKTTASSEAMRWNDDQEVDAQISRGPSFKGNDFDIRMQQEDDGLLAAKKIADVLKERGVCLCQANAPQDLVMAAQEEAEALWDDGEFTAPMLVHDDHSMLERELWQQALRDEEKVFWCKNQTAKTNALKMLSDKIAEFGSGLGPLLQQDMGIKFDRCGRAMLSCYTAERTYGIHLDNCHGTEDEDGFPDNGMRLTLIYYINMSWNPVQRDCDGGLDVFLSDPIAAPTSAAAAKSAKLLRIAPHADTLVIFPSERMAHRVIQTRGDQKWFCLTMWFLDGESMQVGGRKLCEIRQKKNVDSDSD